MSQRLDIPGQKVGYTGDSTAALWTLKPAFDAINAPLTARAMSWHPGPVGSSAPPGQGSLPPPEAITVINTAVGSTGVAELDADFATRVTFYNFDSLVISVGIVNCVIDQMDLAVFETHVDSINDKCVAEGIKVWWQQIFQYRENWIVDGGILRWNGQFNYPNTPVKNIEAYNAIEQASALAHGMIWMPVSDAALQSEPVGNPGSANNGYLLNDDSIHWKYPEGYDFDSNFCLPYFRGELP